MAEVPEETYSSELPAPLLSEETLAKVAGCVHGGLLSQVCHLGPHNVNRYFDLAERLCPVQEAEWSALKEEMLEAVSTAPKLKVFCLTGKVTSYSKRENLVLVTSIRQSGEDGDPVVSRVLEVNEEEITLQLDSSFPVATFSHGTLLLELRKKSGTGIVVASTELPLSEMPEDMTERTVELVPPLKGKSKRQSITSLFCDGCDNLSLMLGREETGVECSTKVPKVLQNHLASKMQQVLQAALPTEDLTRPTFNINVERVENDTESDLSFYQQVISYSKEEFQTKVECTGRENSLNCPIQCLLTDKLVIGGEKKRKSIFTSSPRTRSSDGPPVMRKSRISLPKTLDHMSDNISDMANEMAGMFSPSGKKTDEESTMEIGMDRLIATLANHAEEAFEIDEMPGVQWRAKFCAEGNLLTSKELQLAIVRSLVLAADRNIWPTDLDPVFSILKGITEGSKEEVDGAVAEAYLEAHKLRPQEGNLGHSALNPYVQALAGRGLGQSPTLGKYIDECLDVVEKHRHVAFDKLKEVVANLSVLVAEEYRDLGGRIQTSVEKSAQALFTTWETEAKKDVEERPAKPALAKYDLLKNLERDLSREDVSVNFEICRNVVNKHIYSEVHSPTDVYQNVFSAVLPNYSTVLCNKLVSCAIEILPEHKVPQLLDPAGMGRSLSQLQNSSYDTDKLQMVYDCFVALKRVWNALHPGEKVPDSVYEAFSAYPKRWHDLAIQKAELEVQKLLSYLAKNQHEFANPSEGGTVERQDSEQDITNTTLISFQAIVESCWKWRSDLDWPDHAINLRMGLTMVKTFAKFEEHLLNLFHKIHMEDDNYDAYELSRTIKLLKGLQNRLKTTAGELRRLHEKHLEDEDADPIDSEEFKQQMNEVYENIANMEEKQNDEIQLKVHDYCEGRRQAMSTFISEKKLVSEEEDGIDCLMGFLDKEMKQIYGCLREHRSTVIAQLWKVMEEELTSWFEGRKKRNLQKNKRERFLHVALAITIIIEVKNSLYRDGIIEDSDLYSLNKGDKISRVV